MTVLFICVLIDFACLLVLLREYNKLKTELKKEKDSGAYYKRIVDGFHDKMKEEEEKYEIIQADYCTSDSDMMKFSNDKKMQRAIRSKLAMLIGNDIAKKFEPSVLPLGEGKEKHSLVLKVKKI